MESILTATLTCPSTREHLWAFLSRKAVAQAIFICADITTENNRRGKGNVKKKLRKLQKELKGQNTSYIWKSGREAPVTWKKWRSRRINLFIRMATQTMKTNECMLLNTILQKRRGKLIQNNDTFSLLRKYMTASHFCAWKHPIRISEHFRKEKMRTNTWKKLGFLRFCYCRMKTFGW